MQLIIYCIRDFFLFKILFIAFQKGKYIVLFYKFSNEIGAYGSRVPDTFVASVTVDSGVLKKNPAIWDISTLHFFALNTALGYSAM